MAGSVVLRATADSSTARRFGMTSREGTIRKHSDSEKQCDGAFGADDQRPTFWKRADCIEGEALLLLSVDAAGIVGRAEIKDEVFSHDEKALWRDWFGQFFSDPFRGLLLGLLPEGCSIHLLVVGHGREICLRMQVGERPRLAAIRGESQVGAVVIGMLVVAAGDDAVTRVAEGDGEDAGGFWTVEDGSVEGLPGFSAVRGVEDAGGFAAGGEPGVGIGGRFGGRRSARTPLFHDRNASIAGRESAFTVKGFGQLRRRDGMPGFAIFRSEQLEFRLPLLVGDGITQYDAMLWIPEGHGVEESLGVRIGELKLPVLAGVRRVVNAGLVAWSRGHQKSFGCRERHYGAEVERGGIGNLAGNPGLAAVGGAEIGAVRAAGPGDLARDRSHSAKIFGRVGSLDSRTGLGDGDGRKQ